MGNIQVHELAKRLGIDNQRIMDALCKIGVTGKSHLSALDDHVVVKIKRVLLGYDVEPELPSHYNCEINDQGTQASSEETPMPLTLANVTDKTAIKPIEGAYSDEGGVAASVSNKSGNEQNRTQSFSRQFGLRRNHIPKQFGCIYLLDESDMMFSLKDGYRPWLVSLWRHQDNTVLVLPGTSRVDDNDDRYEGFIANDLNSSGLARETLFLNKHAESIGYNAIDFPDFTPGSKLIGTLTDKGKKEFWDYLFYH